MYDTNLIWASNQISNASKSNWRNYLNQQVNHETLSVITNFIEATPPQDQFNINDKLCNFMSVDKTICDQSRVPAIKDNTWGLKFRQ